MCVGKRMSTTDGAVFNNTQIFVVCENGGAGFYGLPDTPMTRHPVSNSFTKSFTKRGNAGKNN